MKHLTIQIHAPFAFKAKEEILKIAYMHEDFVKPDFGEKYFNLRYETADLKSLWNRIKREFFEPLEEMSENSIVVCQGEDGWSDYLLLHTYFPGEEIDDL